ncbi:Nek1 [Symbiodinium sp. CCMP2592]|nr:Nek1 [Symbiodinium sp. CCMP2592]
MAMMSMPIRRRVRAALLLALGVCALWSFQAHQAFGSATVVEVKEEPSTMVKFVGGHPLLVCFVVMALTGAFACTEVSQATPAGPPEKRPDYNTFLMMQNILCFASGYVNALTIIDMGMTVSHQTGNTSHTGRLIMNGGAAFFHLMAAFAAGSFVAGYSKSDGEAVYQGRYSPNMLASTFCVLGGCLVHYCKAADGSGNDSHSESLLLFAFSQGIQNGVTRRCTSCPICTTHFTGYLTDFGVGLGAWARAQVSGEPSPTLLKVLLFGSGTFFFGLGGVAAKETHGPYGIQAALIPAAIMAAVAGGLFPVIKMPKPAKA